MKSIKFKKHFRAYNPGETAHFNIDLADKLIDAQVADAVGPAIAAEPVSEDKPGKADRKVPLKVSNAQPD